MGKVYCIKKKKTRKFWILCLFRWRQNWNRPQP